MKLKRIIALLLSLVVDGIQILVTPLLAVGGMGEIIDGVIDIFMAVILTLLQGFHWVYLPTFLVGLIPGISELPFWTLAVLVTWNQDLKILKPEEKKRGEDF